jgi:hypothetical protein
MNNSILNIKVSCFENCQGTIPADVILLSWLTSDKHRSKVENLRTIQDEPLQVVIKKSLPAITPSGLFSHRDTDYLIDHSGFLVFDIDKKDNRHISFEGLKEQISHIPSVAYCGLSCRGLGFWGLVPIPKSTPQEHKQRFASLAKDFKVFDINLDPSGSDITRLRIYSYDPEAYFNHNAKLYTKILKPQRKESVRPVPTDTRERVEAVIAKIKRDKIDITEDYQIWLKIGCAFSDEFGEAGRGYFHAVSQSHPEYNPDKTDRLYDDILKHSYDKVSIGWFINLLKDYGIRTKNIEVAPDPAHHVTTLPKVEKIVEVKPGPWSNEIAELESFFNSVQLPSDPIRLDKCSQVTDIRLFIKSHLSIVKGQNGNERYRPYLDRLNEIRDMINLN